MRFMKQAALLLMSTLLFGALPPCQAQDVHPAAHTAARASKVHVLSRAELDQWLAQPDKVLIIDVRRPDEIASIGGLPVYLSIQIKDLAQSYTWIPRDRTIITLSNHAGRASRAADLLTSAGFHVAGAAGAQTYEKAGGKLTHVLPPRRPTGSTAGGESSEAGAN